MDALSDEERDAFLELYGYKDEIHPVPKPILDSLIRRGLLTRGSNSSLAFTKLGDELYEKLRPDEPYEGV